MGDDEPSGDQPGRRTNGARSDSNRPDDDAPRERDQPPRQEADQPGARGVYCTACGTRIDYRAELCPECGVRQPADGTSQGTPQRQGVPGGGAGGHQPNHRQGGPRQQGHGHGQSDGYRQGHGHQQGHGQGYGHQQGHGRGYGPRQGRGHRQGAHELSPERRAELEKIANTDVTGAMLLGFLLTPTGYLLVGKVGLAVINFVTFNYLLLGPIIVPFHVRSMITDARQELRAAGVQGY